MNEKEIKKKVRTIINRDCNIKCRSIAYNVISSLNAIITVLGFVGVSMYVLFLFYYRKFDVLPQWVKYLVPKTTDGKEAFFKFSEPVIDKCNIAVLVFGIIIVALAVASWIMILPKNSKVKTALIVVSLLISIFGGLVVLIGRGWPMWLKTVITVTGSIGWGAFVVSSINEMKFNDDISIGVVILPMAMILFTAICWIYAGAATWWS